MNTVKSTRRFDSRLIQKPHRQPRLQRTAWGFVTLAFWGFYFYLWAPLVTLVSWLLGGQLAWLQLYEYKQAVDPFVLIALPVMLVACAVLLIAWAEYNRLRFAGKERRLPHQDAPLADIARDLGASPALAAQLAGGKAVTLHMDDQARPVGVTHQVLAPTA
ncbi:poly-beta-1,6-N-acetyl-D-glucosamine biosynthesis protein PgaD [Stenotrophomonas rhizophila]|uniref:poly-beta-1,6-N-acetyl-D-glucosamine biosynthesis protein PgaD n=1 Tax=Stenotrophomonas rhizophila TaxID=216778 RepID=UPI001E4B8268|nr:poly-beta-1,6-N-acetyl-D-glucosamine biosynthesis protein PgaD [Stenotrophomonas rhizophila]MCC7632994.1 poly-beta-1,6-N-acetyl-D-glucosamine biosynthesis protein PgaD [Stenotrophomonas rhizophila]MCC7662281.1 poly-beta-1,6-N-acetyl-D-glucosamine biosynthesis protein PgaD [Stenotrophomonas rhizophila]